MTKPAIFLVEDIIDGHPVTLYEKITWKLYQHIRQQKKETFWLSEIPRLLASYKTAIEFVTVKDFIREVSMSGMPKDRDVYYFIVCRHFLDLSNIEDFLLIDYRVLDFLANNHIPIILDTSAEQNNHYKEAHRLAEQKTWLYDRPEFEILKKLEFIVVGSTIIPHEVNQVTSLNFKFTFFPSGFFFYNYQGGPYNQDLIENRQLVIDRINNKQITQDTYIWESWQYTPRWFRIAFQLKAEHLNLTGRIGRYSRLNPGRERMMQFFNNDWFKSLRYHKFLSFLTKDILATADEIKILDNAIPWPMNNNKLSLITKESDSMFFVASESYEPLTYEEIANTKSNLTDKCSLRITSGQAFIPMGGQHLGSILKDLGFREFKHLEWPTQPLLYDEMDYILDRIKFIAGLSLEQRQDLYEEWKENLIHNFNHYIDIDVPAAYLDSIRRAV